MCGRVVFRFGVRGRYGGERERCVTWVSGDGRVGRGCWWYRGVRGRYGGERGCCVTGVSGAGRVGRGRWWYMGVRGMAGWGEVVGGTRVSGQAWTAVRCLSHGGLWGRTEGGGGVRDHGVPCSSVGVAAG